jgi:protein-disulfide isomerase
MAQLAAALDVPAAAYEACVGGDQVAPLIVQDIMFAATRPGMSGTPAFLINDERMLVGLKSFEEWQAVLDAALEKHR